MTLGAITSHRPLLALRERILGDLLDAALLGFGIAAGLAVAALVALHYAGGRLKRGRRRTALRPATPVCAASAGAAG